MPVPWQNRVLEEKTQLDDRLGKLAAFIGSATFKALPAEEQTRLCLQRNAMNAYSNILRERIQNFSPSGA